MEANIFEPKPIGQSVSDLTGELLSALDHIVLCLIKLELNTGRATLLHSLGQKERKGYPFEFDAFVRFYQTLLAPEEETDLSAVLSTAHLKEMVNVGHRFGRINLACRLESGLEWLEIITYLDASEKNAYIIVRQSGDTYLYHRIIDLFVYNNCDCFFYLDAEKNTCTMFNGKSDTPLPPAICTDYGAEVVAYAKKYVVPEDRERVIHEMSLERVLSVLKTSDSHAFSCGMWDLHGRYTRKRLEYRRIDQNKQTILLSRVDVTDLYEEHKQHTKDLEEALRRAKTDPLTGLLNFQGIQEIVAKELLNRETMAAFFFMDLDNFKQVNDIYGHAAGDCVLQAVAEIITESVGFLDYTARIGGDEFVVFLSSIRDLGEAVNCAHRICTRVSQAELGIKDVNLSCSIGIAIAPADGMDYESLARKADQKVYQAKACGKNQFVL